jgi:DNA polymerase-1
LAEDISQEQSFSEILTKKAIEVLVGETTETLYVLDGSSYIHRAYHAMGGLTNSKGFPTGAVFGFAAMIVKTIKDKAPSRLVVVFDAKGKTFRNDIYPLYKANRPPMPEDLRLQIPKIHEIVNCFRIPSLSVEGYEADDIIATLTRLARDRRWDVVIVSSDKDLMQLVGNDVTMWDPQRDAMYDAVAVKEKFGVDPDHLLDFMALTGDSSDNIPGVPGVGPRTASKLIGQFNTLESLYEHLEDIAQEPLRRKISENQDGAFLSRKLADLCDTVPIVTRIDDLVVGEPDTEALRALFLELEFRKFLSELPPEKTLDTSQYRTITGLDELKACIGTLRERKRFAIDLESTSQFPVQADLVGVSLCAEKGVAWYIPVGHAEGEQLSKSQVLGLLKPILEAEEYEKIGQNIKYDLIILKKEGIDLTGITCDTMLASYLLDPSRRGHSLDDLSEAFLNHRTIPIKDLIGSGKSQMNFSFVQISRAAEYSCEDADVTFRLAEHLDPQIEEQGLAPLFRDVELPLIPVLAEMELRGVFIDIDYLSKLSIEFGEALGEIELAIYEMAGESFNINSPKQLGEILFHRLGMKPVKKTKTGQSTALDVLEELALQHELPRKILEYRSLFKLKSTYVDTLPTLVNPKTGRIHTSYNQAVAATGRLSSSDPNLQNIPVRTQEGRKVRKAFKPADGYVFVAADYSQVELRVMAHLSGDRRLVEAFTLGEDIHAITAAGVFDCAHALVTPEMRRKAKAINFGIIYGMGPFKLARQIGVGLKLAKKYLEDYYETYSGVKCYMDQLPEQAKKDGFVTTILGRKRFLPDLNSQNKIAQQAAFRMAVNTTIQGSAADLMKLAMIQVDKMIRTKKIPGHLILQVHDELILEVEENLGQEAAHLVESAMENVYPLRVPLAVDVAIGRDWEEAH